MLTKICTPPVNHTHITTKHTKTYSRTNRIFVSGQILNDLKKPRLSRCLYTDHHLVWEDFGCDKLVILTVYTLISTLYERTLAVTNRSFTVFIHWSPPCMGGLWLWQTSHSHCLYTDHHLVWEDFGCDKLVFLNVYTLISTLYERTLAVTNWSFSMFIHWSPPCMGGLWLWQTGLSQCLYTDHHLVWEDFGCDNLVFLTVYTLITTLYGRTLAVTIWSFSLFIHWSPPCMGGLWLWQTSHSHCLYTDHHLVWEDFGCDKLVILTVYTLITTLYGRTLAVTN